MNELLGNKLKKLPSSPGVYFHKSKSGEVIYVGKAAVLKNRVRQYFQYSRSRDNKTMALVADIYDVEWVETESEVDALFLESEMVKRYMPKYNVLLRDDRSQAFVRIDMKSEWPTVTFTRNPADDGAEYIGPFYNSFAVKKALRYLRRVFPYLTRERRPGQSRLDEDMGLSPRLKDGSADYKANLRKLISYIKGNRKKITNDLETEMKKAASQLEFEKATKLRNKLRVMQELQRRVMFGDQEFLDISKDRALADIVKIFGMKNHPARIEGFDISHISGSSVVASMVVFTNGVSNRNEYRKFKVSEKNDDPANMREVIYRRLGEKNIKSWGLPDLIIVDGGASQLAAAISARDERGVQVPIVGIAKREEEIYIHDKSQISTKRLLEFVNSQDQGDSSVDLRRDKDFYILNLHIGRRKAYGHAKNLNSSFFVGRHDDVIKLFQRIRDESHRFAVSYHSSLRRKNQTKNVLETIPGVGQKTRAKLIRRFGSAKGVSRASLEELSEVVGAKLAGVIYGYFSGVDEK